MSNAAVGNAYREQKIRTKSGWPSTKRANSETIIESYRFMNNQWENGIDAESGGGLKEAFSPMNCLFCMEGDEGWMCFQVEGLQKQPMCSNNLEQGHGCWNQHVQFASLEDTVWGSS
eukprot:jgi/Picre1/33220/NNA_008545.t1